MVELFVAPVRRVLKRGGAERMSKAGTLFVRQALEEYSIRISEEAIKICLEDGRKIIKDSDIQEATLRLKPRSRTFESGDEDTLFRAPVRRLMKSAGAERISASVIGWLKQEMEEYAFTITSDAVSLRRYGGTVLKARDIEEAARSGGVYITKLPVPLEILMGERWVEAGKHLLGGYTIRVRRKGKMKVRLWHIRRGKREVLFDNRESGPVEIELPRVPKHVISRGDVIYHLEMGDESVEVILLPRGYGEDSIRRLIRFVIEAQFDGLELNHGPIFLPSGFSEHLIKRGSELSKEYGNIVAYHLVRKTIMNFLRQ